MARSIARNAVRLTEPLVAWRALRSESLTAANPDLSIAASYWPIAVTSVSRRAPVASMSLLDMDDFEGAIAETDRVLRPGGVFCFAIVHPFDSACGNTAASAGTFVVSQPYLTSRRYEDHFEWDGLGISLDRHATYVVAAYVAGAAR
jgi:SAM-dependent methyltransferase